MKRSILIILILSVLLFIGVGCQTISTEDFTKVYRPLCERTGGNWNYEAKWCNCETEKVFDLNQGCIEKPMPAPVQQNPDPSVGLQKYSIDQDVDTGFGKIKVTESKIEGDYLVLSIEKYGDLSGINRISHVLYDVKFNPVFPEKTEGNLYYYKISENPKYLLIKLDIPGLPSKQKSIGVIEMGQ